MVARSKMLALPIAMLLMSGLAMPAFAQSATDEYPTELSPEPGLEPNMMANDPLCKSQFVLDIIKNVALCKAPQIAQITAGAGQWTVVCAKPLFSVIISDGTGNKPPKTYNPAPTAENVSKCVPGAVCVAKNGTVYCTNNMGVTTSEKPAIVNQAN